MLDPPGHKAGSGPQYAGGPGPNATSRGRDAGARRRDAGVHGGDPAVRGPSRGREAGAPGRDAATRGPSRGRQAPPGPPLRWWGSRPGRAGIALVIGGALIGLLGTLLTGSEPGAVLGILLLAGTAAGALAVRPRAAYLIIPVPAPAYLAAAILALYGAWPGSFWGEPQDLGQFSLGLLWQPPNTDPEVYYRDGDRPWFAEYHWHGIELLTGNAFLLGGLALFAVLIAAALRTRVTASRTPTGPAGPAGPSHPASPAPPARATS